MISYKKLFSEQSKILEEKSRELRALKKDYEELEEFIEWINSFCWDGRRQLCGIKKLNLSGCYSYIGFVLDSELCIEPQRRYEYVIKGYLSSDKRKDPVYKAYVSQTLSEIPIGIENKLKLGDNQVLFDNLKRKGIGTAGMSIIKELAKQLHCTEIYGKRVAIPNTPEERAKLDSFYKSNGFLQDEESGHLSFRMDQYAV